MPTPLDATRREPRRRTPVARRVCVRAIEGPVLALLAVHASAARAQECPPTWSCPVAPDSAFYGSGSIRVIGPLEFDEDGPGGNLPVLIVAGQFSAIGRVPARSIARWNGDTWSEVGGGLPSGNFSTMQVLDPDAEGPARPLVHLAGSFSSIGGVPAARIAFWDGQSWSSIPSTTINTYNQFVYFDPDADGPEARSLHAAGFFSLPGGDHRGVARWTGAQWAPVGASFFNDGSGSLKLSAFEVFDEDGEGGAPARLFVAGQFTRAGVAPVSGVARLVGDQWTDVGGGVVGEVTAMRAFDFDADGAGPPALCIAGLITSAGATPTQRFARWDGAHWMPFVLPPNLSANQLTLYTPPPEHEPNALYAVGRFYLSGGQLDVQGHVARLFEETLSVIDLAPREPPHRGTTVALFDRDGSGPAPPAFHSDGFRLQGSDWRALDTRPTGDILALTEWDDDGPGARAPVIVAGGVFTGAGVHDTGRVAVFDAGRWRPLDADGGGVTGSTLSGLAIRALAVDPRAHAGASPLYVGGSFTSIGPAGASAPALNVAMWDGEAWSALGAGFPSPVNALRFYDEDAEGPAPPALIVAGGLATSGSALLSRIARWDGGGWSPLGNGFNSGIVTALATFDEDGPGPQPARLFAAGSFSLSGATVVQRVARWDGVAWSGVGGELVAGSIRSMTAWDPDADGPAPGSLILGGAITAPLLTYQPQLNNIARWTGAAWTAMGAGIPGGFPTVYAVSSFDHDGPSGAPATLVASTAFGLRAWDTESEVWAPFPGASTPEVYRGFALAESGRTLDQREKPTLLVGGSLTSNDNVPISGFSAITTCAGPAPACPGDINADGRIDMFDLTALLGRYAAACIGDAADTNADGLVNFLDLNAVLSGFGQPCLP